MVILDIDKINFLKSCLLLTLLWVNVFDFVKIWSCLLRRVQLRGSLFELNSISLYLWLVSLNANRSSFLKFVPCTNCMIDGLYFGHFLRDNQFFCTIYGWPWLMTYILGLHERIKCHIDELSIFHIWFFGLNIQLCY